MRSFASADALGVLGWPGAQKKCFGLLSDCAAGAGVANTSSNAMTTGQPDIHPSEWARICDLPRCAENSGLPAPIAGQAYKPARVGIVVCRFIGTGRSGQLPRRANPQLLAR